MHGNMILRPWAGAHAQGRTGFAALLFLMQVSLVFWPAAVRVAQRLGRDAAETGAAQRIGGRTRPRCGENPV